MTDLQPGDRAPDFDLPTDGGGRIKLSDYAGKTLVLYFYPKDDTSGCTAEAQGFSDALDDFAKAGATVVGVSKDSPAKHDRFKAKYDLKLTLASDEDGAMLERWGVWVEKSLYGRKYMGIDRATFVVGPDGAIRHVWRKVKVPGHVAKVLESIKS